MKILLNVSLDAEFPEELTNAFKTGAQKPLQDWAMARLLELLDGECEVEFGAELLGVQVRTSHGR